MHNKIMDQSRTIWGWKTIASELGKILGEEPSHPTVRRWAARLGLPVKRNTGTGRVCANVIDLEQWRARMIK